jgi:hypothetical protein
MLKHIINCTTGEEETREMTDEEIALLTPSFTIQQQIEALTAKITPEALMNYTLGDDGGFLQGIKDQIDNLRKQL